MELVKTEPIKRYHRIYINDGRRAYLPSSYDVPTYAYVEAMEQYIDGLETRLATVEKTLRSYADIHSGKRWDK